MVSSESSPSSVKSLVGVEKDLSLASFSSCRLSSFFVFVSTTFLPFFHERGTSGSSITGSGFGDSLSCLTAGRNRRGTSSMATFEGPSKLTRVMFSNVAAGTGGSVDKAYKDAPLKQSEMLIELYEV